MTTRRYSLAVAWSVGYGVLAVTFCAPLFTEPHAVGTHDDWDLHLFYYGAVFKSLFEYGVPPFWNPWYCGGNVLWQNPQAAVLSPTYLVSVLTSLPLAMKVNILLHYWVGLLGMHALVRRVFVVRSRAMTVFLVSVFTLSGAHALHLAVGHAQYLAAFYLPLQAFLFFRVARTGLVRYGLGAGAMLALMVYNGGLHVMALSLMLFGVIALVGSAVGRWWRPLVAAMVMVAAGFGMAAPKLLPVVFFVTGDRFRDTRILANFNDWTSLDLLLHAYLDRYQYTVALVGDGNAGWHEYGNYTGAFFALLAAASLLWVVWHQPTSERWVGMALGIGTVWLLVLSAGEFSAVAPASIVSQLPFFSSFKIHSRYTFAVVLAAVMVVAWVWRRLEEDQLASSARRVMAVLCVLATADVVFVNRTVFSNAFLEAPLEQSFQFLGGPSSITVDDDPNPYVTSAPMLRRLVADRSLFSCYETLQLQPTATPDQSPVLTDERSRVLESAFSPNRIDVTLLSWDQPSTVFLNQNFARGWRSSVGPITLDEARNRPAVQLDANQVARHSFSFVPEGIWLGTAILVLTIVASALVWRRRLPL